MIRRLWCLALVLAGGLGLSWVGSAPANAHATLLRAEPRDSAVLTAAPSEAVLVFNEPVAPLIFKLVRPDGTSVPLDANARNETVRLPLPPGLRSGTSLLSWRVISADGHPVGGALLFSVGHTSAPANLTQDTSDTAVRAAILVARIVLYIGLFFGIGGAFFMAWTIPARASVGTRIIATSLAAAFAAALLSIGLQGLDSLAAPLSDIGHPSIWLIGSQTTYAYTALIAAFALLLALLSLLPRRPRRLLSLIALLGLSLALASSGHGSAASPQILMRPAVFIHAGAIALWGGSLIPLFLLLREPTDGRAPLMQFSRTAPFVVAALSVAGIALAVVQVARPDMLWTTAYGRIFLLKCAALVALAALAAVNRFLLTPAVLRGERAASRRLRQSIAAEIALAVVIFCLAAGWRFTPPPRALLPSEPAFVHLHGETAMADVTLEPGRAGPTELRIHLMHEDLSPLAAKEVSVRLSNPNAGIEAIVRSAVPDEPGHWRANNLILPVAGIWTVEIDALVGDFDKVRLDGPMVVEP
jgi:copper transport protein